MLERWDALVLNRTSMLFMVKDSVFTIAKPYFYKQVAYKKNDHEDDQKLLVKYALKNVSADTTFKTYCNDCDFYRIYKVYKSPAKTLTIDTIYSGNGL